MSESSEEAGLGEKRTSRFWGPAKSTADLGKVDKKWTKIPNFRLFVLTATFCHPNYNYIELCLINFLQLPLGLTQTQYEKK